MRDLSGHRTALGFLYLFVHALTLLGAAGLAFATWALAHIATGRATRHPVWDRLPVQLMVGFTLLVLVLAIAGLCVGLALVRGEPVSRGLALVLSLLALMNFPVGTVMGVYSLWFFNQEGWDREPEPTAWAS
ncbi:MAG: hypothetical protein EOO71_24775 [Myxococcaceae bacterium]|nr:MAG: hypothetical protein EOO71_24775 [Myxococcaceae bacterium]